MDVRGVAGQEHAPMAVSGDLAAVDAKAREPDWVEDGGPCGAAAIDECLDLFQAGREWDERLSVGQVA